MKNDKLVHSGQSYESKRNQPGPEPSESEEVILALAVLPNVQRLLLDRQS
jgi:hypothetical protein